MRHATYFAASNIHMCVIIYIHMHTYIHIYNMYMHIISADDIMTLTKPNETRGSYAYLLPYRFPPLLPSTGILLCRSESLDLQDHRFITLHTAEPPILDLALPVPGWSLPRVCEILAETLRKVAPKGHCLAHLLGCCRTSRVEEPPKQLADDGRGASLNEEPSRTCFAW